MNKFLLVLVSAFLSVPALANPITSTANTPITGRSILNSGAFFWDDAIQTNEPIFIEVNLKKQMAYVWRGETLIGATNVSSGKAGFDTPAGTFTVLGKEDNHWSKKYEADMPYTMWISNSGVALHSGGTPGRPTSHGCVHLPKEFARLLYQVVDKSTVVEVTNEHPMTTLVLNLR